jgi:aconitate hydratase
LAQGEPVECIVTHAGGGTETLLLAHSFTTAQLAWFHAGGALNLVPRT